MLFYRVEDANGEGPYQTKQPGMEVWYMRCDFEHDMIKRHPMPHDDAGLCAWYNPLSWEVRKHHHYAFKDLDQFKSWFYTMASREYLKRYGYQINVYECDDGQYGDTQAMFRKDEAKFLYSLELTEV
jgi:hypothetical protein